MSFDKIILPESLMVDLYKDSLVVIDNEISTAKKPDDVQAQMQDEEMILVNKTVAKTPDEPPKKSLSWLGNNRKNITILVNDVNAIHLQDDLLEILSAILSACKLNLADVAIVNTNNQDLNDGILRTGLNPSNVILFGIETSAIGLPFSIPDYKVQAFNNCSYLQAASLEKMKGNSTEAKMEKSKLWLSLKTMFGI